MTGASVREFLARIELLRDLDPAQLDAVAAVAGERHCAPGEVIFAAHSRRRELLMIVSGEVELVVETVLRGERSLVRFGPGDFLGEGALLEDYPHATTARAVSATCLLAVAKSGFDALVERDPQIGSKVLGRTARVMSRRMRLADSPLAAGAQYASGRTRREQDLLGERDVPYEAYYGIQTLRAVENFPISGITLAHFPEAIAALAMVKQAAARANAELGYLTAPVAAAIDQACNEIRGGRYHADFVVDLIQGGAGTSTNMNANEVIANRALEILGHGKGQYEFCHPHNHVNLAQSTNDVYPTALKIALIGANRRLIGVLAALADACAERAETFREVIKMGRTQLQDAVPMTLGQTFQAWATTLREEIERLQQNAELFLEINLGGTAIGTGINADPRYAAAAVRHLRELSGLDLKLAADLVEATQDTGAFVMYSSAVKRLAVKLSKICNDLRLLSSGPRAGLNEINLPKMQPGSSIMPGKVNPVIPEVVNQIAFKVIGNDLTVTLAAEAGQLELNVFEPVIVQSLLESIEMLINGMATLQQRCLEGISANPSVCRQQVERSIGLVTALSPVLGYEVCSALAREALAEDRGVYELVLAKGLLSRAELDRLLAPESMLGPA